MSDESINSITGSNYSIAYVSAEIRVTFNGSCLKQDKITYAHGKTFTLFMR